MMHVADVPLQHDTMVISTASVVQQGQGRGPTAEGEGKDHNRKHIYVFARMHARGAERAASRTRCVRSNTYMCCCYSYTGAEQHRAPVCPLLLLLC